MSNVYPLPTNQDALSVSAEIGQTSLEGPLSAGPVDELEARRRLRLDLRRNHETPAQQEAILLENEKAEANARAIAAATKDIVMLRTAVSAAPDTLYSRRVA